MDLKPHVHIGLVEGAVVFTTVLLFGTLWRYMALKAGDTAIGRTMLFAY